MPATAALRHARLRRPRLTARGLLDRLVRFDALWRARAHLEALDDRMLRDIGLTRADVDAELRRPFPR